MDQKAISSNSYRIWNISSLVRSRTSEDVLAVARLVTAPWFSGISRPMRCVSFMFLANYRMTFGIQDTFAVHPGFRISEDWFFGMSLRFDISNENYFTLVFKVMLRVNSDAPSCAHLRFSQRRKHRPTCSSSQSQPTGVVSER